MLETVWESRWLPDFQWGRSSVGRAPALQAGGQEFESLRLHWIKNYFLIQKVSDSTETVVPWKPNTETNLILNIDKTSEAYVLRDTYVKQANL